MQAYKRWDQIVVSHRAWVRKAAYSCYLRQKEKVQKEMLVAFTTGYMMKKMGYSKEKATQPDSGVTAYQS